MKKRIFSGVRVSGDAHIANYFGAMKQFVDLQNSGYEIFVMVANLHSLNSLHNAAELKKNTINLIKDFLAIGLDPEKVTIFLQSDISEHTELTWIFDCLVTLPYLERSHAYKDSVANGREANMGLFNYPVLMAADILLYSPDIVPVGSDQKQHVEYARDIAGKFNNKFGETFKLPEDKISTETGIVPGIDGRKMSKSYKNHIPLFATDPEIRKICATVVTDSLKPEDIKNPDESNIFAIYKLMANEQEQVNFRARFENGGLGYKEAKEILADKIIEFVKPMRDLRDKITDEQVYVVMENGAKKAKKIASEKMSEVYEKTGIIKNI